MRQSGTRFSRFSRLGLLSLPLLGGVLLAGCDVDPTSELATRSLPKGSEPVPAAESCGEPIEIPQDSAVIATTAGTMIVTSGYEDPVARMTGATSTEYWCSCDEGVGTCNVQNPSGNYVTCLSSDGCTKCTLNKSKGPQFAAFSHLLGTCDDPGSYDDDLADTRAKQVIAWSAKMGYPKPFVGDGGHAVTASKGFGLVAEVVGGRTLSYQVPLQHFDAQGELLSFVGPVNTGPDYIAQVAGGGNLRCLCDGEGTCSWTENRVCSGGCLITEGNRGCFVTGKAKPIKF